MKIAFWISLFIVFYAFLGYGILLFILIKLRRIFKGNRPISNPTYGKYPSCALIIAAYNEERFIREKIVNTLALNYPNEKLKIIVVTDGSTDRTPEIVQQFPEITLLHHPQRNGKVAAVHRAVEQANSDILVFTDANTFLNKEALLTICRHYEDPEIGGVAGEKRVYTDEKADASAAGEGLYWEYESTLKKWDSELYAVMGAAGEVFSIRRSLYQPVHPNTILDDFMLSMLIVKKGYRVIYEPEAYATETASENITEELKRKIRIAAGGMQSIWRLRLLLNIFKYPVIGFQYISHRVLRWTVAPLFLILLFFSNTWLLLSTQQLLYPILFIGQSLFYLMAALGLLLEKKQLRIKLLFVPYYFCIMNYAVLAGIIRYVSNKQSSTWEKAKRK